MLKSIKRKSLQMSAAFTAGTMASGPAFAAAAGGNGPDISTIAQNITTSIASVPGLLTGLAYMFGILLAVLGILKIKDHVENPGNAPLKDGAIRLAAGGALLALPICYKAVADTINGGTQGASASTAILNKVSFAVQ